MDVQNPAAGQTALSYEQRRQERFERKATAAAVKYLRRITDLPHMPQTMGPFLQTLQRIHADRLDVLRPEGMPTVGTYCVMVPPELVYAAGAMPVKLCSGSYTAFSIGDDVTPRDACPLVKAVIGAEEIGCLPVYGSCALTAIPVTCDCKKKLAGYLERRRPVVTLHVPANRADDEDMERFVEELYRLSGALTGLTGRALNYAALENACALMAGAQYQLSRFTQLRRRSPLLLAGTHALAVMNAFSYTHAALWARQLEALNDELEARLNAGETAFKATRPRILLTGSPIVFPNFKLPLLIEEMGGALVADETCMGERGLYDPPAVVEPTVDGVMRALANRATRPCTCPTFVDNRRRLFRIRQLIQDYQVQGVICHVLRGCVVYDYEYKALEDELGRLGIPVIRVETDYNEEDVEQLHIRVEAFVELIKYGKGMGT